MAFILFFVKKHKVYDISWWTLKSQCTNKLRTILNLLGRLSIKNLLFTIIVFGLYSLVFQCINEWQFWCQYIILTYNLIWIIWFINYFTNELKLISLLFKSNGLITWLWDLLIAWPITLLILCNRFTWPPWGSSIALLKIDCCIEIFPI